MSIGIDRGSATIDSINTSACCGVRGQALVHNQSLVSAILPSRPAAAFFLPPCKPAPLFSSSTLIVMSGLPESYLREKQPANIIAGGAVLTSLATLCVVARVYTHTAVTRNFGAEDVFIIFANLFLFVLLVGFIGRTLSLPGSLLLANISEQNHITASATTSLHWTVSARHTSISSLVLTPSLAPQISGFFRWFYMAIWASAGAVTCTKFSIAFQYRRIFATPRFQITVKIMLMVITIFGLWTFLSSIF